MLLLQSREQTGKESVQNLRLSTVWDWTGHRCARAAVQPFMKTPARLHLQNSEMSISTETENYDWSTKNRLD